MSRTVAVVIAIAVVLSGAVQATPAWADTVTVDTPVISGSAGVGSTLTVAEGTWSPAETTFTYQWTRDNTPIGGATSSTYVTVLADIGSDIRAVVTGLADGFDPDSATTSNAITPTLNTFGTTTDPIISGTTAFGSTLTASVSGWVPSTGVTYTYQWHRTIGLVTTDIDGATAATYQLALADIGATISVTVEGTKSGYTAASTTSSDTSAIGSASFGTTTNPTISGTKKVASTLTASVSGWVPSSGVTYTYQWHRTVDSITTDISSATDSTYVLSAEDLGATISVTVRGTKTGYTAESTTSDETTTISRANFVSAANPTISGTKKVTYPLTANVSGWDPSDDVSYTYQWHRTVDSVTTDIADATDSTYFLSATDLGATISVTVQGSKTGYNTASRTSAVTSAIAATDFATTTDPTISGTATFGSTLTADVTGWSPSEDIFYTYQWHRTINSVTTDISFENGATYRLTVDDIGATISVTVTGYVAGYNHVSTTSEETATVVADTFVTTTDPTITGTTTFGSTLTAHVSGWSPSTGVSYSYQWKRDGTNIASATSATYVLAVADIDAVISVTVTGTKAGYAAESTTSADTETIAAETFTNTYDPEILGSTTFGSTLTAHIPTWSPSSGVSYTYQWKRDGDDIAGATSSTYVLTVADVDAVLTVAIEGSKAGYSSVSATSAATDTITTAPFATTTRPTITGNAIFGSTLTGHVSGWSPSSAVSFAYQWKRDGEDIPDATSSTYVLTVDDVDTAISVSVEGAKTGYTATTTTSVDTATVVTAAFVTTTVPTITGTKRVASTLSASVSGWSPAPDEPFTYQWHRTVGLVTTDIDGATESTYELTGEDFAATISVTVEGSKTGYTPTNRTSARTAAVTAASFDVVGTPSMSGTLAIDDVLTADPGSWEPEPESFTYQWKRNNVAITDATEDTYTLTPADMGTDISVRVTATLTGYATTVATSAATSVPLMDFETSGVPEIDGAPDLGETVTVLSDVFSPIPDSLSYQWYRDGEEIDGETTDSYTIVLADSAADITVDVTASLLGYNDLTVTSDPVTASEILRYSTSPRPSITGIPQVGRTLEISSADWTPTPDSFDYQWLRNGVAIGGATSDTYELVGQDAGTAISVQVTPVLANYVPITRVSQPTSAVLTGLYAAKPIPTITGTTAVGRLLTAVTAGWDPTPTSFTYVWLRNGIAISDATSSTYRLMLADRGFVISVRVTPVLTGYSSPAKTSIDSDVVVTGSFTSTTLPTISGTVAVGQRLTATTAAWTPAATFTYQWKRGGTAITDATSAQYTVAPADAGSRLTVTVTGAADGITAESTTSAQTIIVPSLSFSGGSNPVISGDASVGATLSVSFGTLTPRPTTTAYQWKRNGADIAGATSATYVATSDDEWQDITVTVTASSVGYTSWTRTTATAVTVSAGVIGSLTVPRITGTTRVGSTLRGTTGTWTNTPDTYDYQWYRDGELIDGETEITYVLTEEDLGSTLALGVTAHKEGFVDESAFSVATDEVRLARFNAQPVPAITGTAKVASTLTAVTGSWSPTATSFTYQWTRGGIPITGATGSTYVLTSADAGALIRVIVTGVRENFEGDPKTSLPTIAVASGTFTATPVPTISGVAKVDELLTATVPAWTPTVDSTTYQWKRNGVAISGATSLTYRVAAADLSALLTFSATGTKAGFVSAVSTSAATTPVIAAVFGTQPVPTITGIASVGELLTARAGTWLPTPDGLSYQWRRDAVTIAGATSATYVLQPADAGKAISVVVTATRTAYTSASRTSTSTDPVAALVFDDAVKPTLDGTEVVGNTLRVSPGDWTPAPTSFTYQWLRDGDPIDGANASTYTLVGEDAESVISAEVTGIKLGYESTTMTTDETGSIEFGTLTATPTPTISGIARVGSPLTVAAGTWSPRPVDLAYQWMRDGEDIDDATETRYTPTAEDLDAVISVRVEASKLGYFSETMTSADTAAVVEGIMTATPVPTISGTVQVGKTLTARPGTWRPDGIELAYQWKRGTSNIAGATTSTYALVAADAGATISVRVTGTLEAYTEVVKTSVSTAAVALGAFTTAPTPTVSGQFTVGKTLTATAGTWTPSATLAYKWYRGTKVIVGATSPTYVLTTTDSGQKVSVAVTATYAGYAVTTATSAPRTVNLGVFDTAPTPTITGTARVGSTLTAVSGSWSPTAELSYKWNRNGTPINGATASTYAVIGADAGATLSVTVTATKTAYENTSKTSAPTASVSTVDFTASPTPTISGTASVGSVLTANANTWLPTPSSLAYQWYRDAAPIVGATRATYTLVAADLGTEITVKVTGTLLGYNTAQKTSVATAEIDSGTFSPAPTPTISGTERVGQVLTASAGTWGPVTPTLTYQWKRDGSVIAGAQSRTYELAAADVGANITVDVTATAPGFDSSSVTSAATGDIALGVLTPAPIPTITGTMGVGATVTATPGTWGPGSVSLAYQWKRNGTNIGSATTASYVIVGADLGASITVEVTATRAGFATTVKTSAARVAVAGTFTNLVLPSISGTATVGSVLTATPGTWSTVADSVTYQWLRNGAAISGATGTTYTLVASDRGKKINVRVTVVKSNYTTTSKDSAALRIS
jgi:hypothetical protein